MSELPRETISRLVDLQFAGDAAGWYATLVEALGAEQARAALDYEIAHIPVYAAYAQGRCEEVATSDSDRLVWQQTFADYATWLGKLRELRDGTPPAEII